MKRILKLIVLLTCSMLLLTGCPGGGKKETASNVKAKITITAQREPSAGPDAVGRQRERACVGNI